MHKSTVYVVTDTETTKKNGLVFDAAWCAVDRHGQVYGSGSYLLSDVLRYDDPFWKEKIGEYWKLVHKGKIRPTSTRMMRRQFNDLLRSLKNDGPRVIFTAYNCAFDAGALSSTADRMLKMPFIDVPGVELLDLWHAFCEVIPQDYCAPISEKGNYSTNAESVFAFIKGYKPGEFIEKHVAHSDVLVELDILAWILRQKQKLHVVNKTKDFVSSPWRIAHQRLGVKTGSLVGLKSHKELLSRAA